MADKILKFTDSAPLLIGVGDRLMNEGKFDSAADFYYRAVQKGGKGVDGAMTRLASVYHATGDTMEAIVWYIRALHVNHECEAAYEGLVKEYCELGFELRDTAVYYFTLGRNKGIMTEEEVEDITCLTEFCEELDDEMSGRVMRGSRLKESANDAMRYDRGKRFMRENALMIAYSVFAAIEENDPNYYNARTMMMKIDAERGQYEIAAATADSLIKAGVNEDVALIVGAKAYREIGEKKRSKEMFEKVTDTSRFACDDLEIAAEVAWKNGSHDKARKFIDRTLEYIPWDRKLLLASALNYANLGETEKSRLELVKLRRLYPDDKAVEYYFDSVLRGEKGFDMLETVPELEALRREDAIDCLVTRLSTIDKVEKEAKKNRKFAENLKWLFQEGICDLQGEIGAFLARSDYFLDMLQQFLIDPRAEEEAKKEILLELLTVEEPYSIAVTTGDLYRVLEFDPTRTTGDYARDVHRYAFVMLAFYCEGFASDLADVMEMLCADVEKLGEEDEDGLDIPAVAAAICYRSNVSRTNMTKPDCVKLFGCNKNKFESYVESPEFTDAGIRRPRAKDFMLRRLIKRGE